MSLICLSCCVCFSPLTHSPCNGSSEVCESPSRDDDAFDTHFDNRLHMPNSGISEFQLQFQFRFRVRRMSSLTLPINFVLNWVLNAGRRQQQQQLALPTDATPQPTYSPPLPIPTPPAYPFANSSDDDCRQTPRNKCAQCATVRVVPCDISARLPLLSSLLPSLPSAGHNSSVVANLLCPILNRCSRRFLYCPVLVLLYSTHSSSLAQFELRLEINKFHMLVGHTHTSH